MRIVLLVPVFPRLSETFIAAKLLGLLERGWDVHLVCMRAGPAGEWGSIPGLSAPAVRRRVHAMAPTRPVVDVVRTVRRIGMTLLRRPGAMGPWLRQAARSAGAARRLWFDSAVAALDPDLIHFEFGAVAVGRTDLKRRLGCRLAVSFRGYDVNYAGLDQPGFYHEVWRNADGLHFLGEDLWRRALARGCAPGLPHVVIPPAIDVARFDPGPERTAEPRGTVERPLRIASVGRLVWKKGFEDGLEAARRLADRGIRFQWTLAGDGPDFECLAFARHQLGLDDRVELDGWLPPEAVRALLREADVFFHPAVSEGFCNAVLEAQAMCLPVVCTDADGLRENVADGKTGFVAPRGDPPAMADRLARLARDPGLRRRMGRAGRERVLERFRIEDQIPAFEAFYEEILGGR